MLGAKLTNSLKNGLFMNYYYSNHELLENLNNRWKSRIHKITCAQCTEIINLNYLIGVGIPSDLNE